MYTVINSCIMDLTIFFFGNHNKNIVTKTK